MTLHHNLQLIDRHDYRADSRPRHWCATCGEVTRRNVSERGGWEIQRCEKCGAEERYRVR